MVMLSDAVTAKQQSGQAREDVQVLDVSQILARSLKAAPAAAAAPPGPAATVTEDVVVEAPKPVAPEPAQTAVADYPQLAQQDDPPTTAAGHGPQDAPAPERSTGTPGDAPGGKSEHQQVGPPTAPPE